MQLQGKLWIDVQASHWTSQTPQTYRIADVVEDNLRMSKVIMGKFEPGIDDTDRPCQGQLWMSKVVLQ